MASSDVSTQARKLKTSKRPLFRRPTGLAVEATFCPEDVADPFDTVEWDLRAAAIKGGVGRGAV